MIFRNLNSGLTTKRAIANWRNDVSTRTLDLSNSIYKDWRQKSWNGIEGRLIVQVFSSPYKVYEYWVGGDYGYDLRYALYASSEGLPLNSGPITSINLNWSTGVMTIKLNVGGSVTVMYEIAPYEDSQ